MSPDDPKLDLETKRREYAPAGIAEYWIVDPRTQELLILTLAEKQYVVHGVFAVGEIATSLLLSHFDVTVADIFSPRSYPQGCSWNGVMDDENLFGRLENVMLDYSSFFLILVSFLF